MGLAPDFVPASRIPRDIIYSLVCSRLETVRGNEAASTHTIIDLSGDLFQAVKALKGKIHLTGYSVCCNQSMAPDTVGPE
jgi:hypothetical protein